MSLEDDRVVSNVSLQNPHCRLIFVRRKLCNNCYITTFVIRLTSCSFVCVDPQNEADVPAQRHDDEQSMDNFYRTSL